MTGYAFFQDHPNWTDLSGGIWVSVENGDEKNYPIDRIKVIDPCGPKEEVSRFGCAQLAKHMKVSVIPKGTDPKDFVLPPDVVITNPHLQCNGA